MKCIKEIDDKWHVIDKEIPSHTVNHIEFLKHDGTIVEGEITIDMAGWYIYLNPGWGSPGDYTHWRFTEKSVL